MNELNKDNNKTTKKEKKPAAPINTGIRLERDDKDIFEMLLACALLGGIIIALVVVIFCCGAKK